jgi:hypothetical protein
MDPEPTDGGVPMDERNVVDLEEFEPAVLVTYDDFDSPTESLRTPLSDLELLEEIEAHENLVISASGLLA